MKRGKGHVIGTMSWHYGQIELWSSCAQTQIRMGHPDLAASYARSCFLHARLINHWTTQEPREEAN